MAETLVFLPSSSTDYAWLQGIKAPSLHLCDPDQGCPTELGEPLSPRVALDLADARKPSRILIGDLSCAAALAALREAGWPAERIGTRRFGGDRNGEDGDPDAGFDIREQIAAACGLSWTLGDSRDAAWQRDGWAGLSALGIAWDDANQRVGALAGGDKAWQTFKTKADEAQRRELDDLILALVPQEDLGLAADALQAPKAPRKGYGTRSSAEAPCPADRDPRDYLQAMHRRDPVAVKPVLVLGHSGTTPDLGVVTRVEYRGPRSQAGWLRDLIDAPDLGQGLDLTLEIGRYRCRLTAELPNGPDTHPLDALVSRLLSVALVTGRPLRHYGCTFYLPLDLHLDAELNPPAEAGDRLSQPAGAPADLAEALAAKDPHRVCTPAEAVQLLSGTISAAHDPNSDRRCRVARGDLDEQVKEAQALLYFLPALQGRIFDTGGDQPDDSVRHWRLSPDSLVGLELTVVQDGGDPPRHTACIQDVSLFGYRNGLFVLAIRTGMSGEQETAAEGLTGDGPGWWHPLFGPRATFESIQGLQAERWLWFTKAARLLRPAFPQQELEGKIAKLSLTGPGCHNQTFDHTHAFSPIVLCLLETLTGIGLPEASERLRQVCDDRMVVNCAYGLAGPAPGGRPLCPRRLGAPVQPGPLCGPRYGRIRQPGRLRLRPGLRPGADAGADQPALGRYRHPLRLHQLLQLRHGLRGHLLRPRGPGPCPLHLWAHVAARPLLRADPEPFRPLHRPGDRTTGTTWGEPG